MPSPFQDDDVFPDRPDTLDFWRLSEVVLMLDGRSGGVGFRQPFDGVIDLPSVEYMGRQRVEIALSGLGLPDPGQAIKDLMVSVFMTAVVTGIEFQRAGGHRG